MNLDLPIKLECNVDANIAEIMKQKAENYGYNEYIYVGDKSIKMFHINENGEKGLNDNLEDCKCKICPYAKKTKENVIIKGKNSFIHKCNCIIGLSKYYEYFSNTEAWSKYTILELDCKICRKIYKNPEYNNINKNMPILYIVNGTLPINLVTMANIVYLSAKSKFKSIFKD